jgi:phage-related protein
MNKVREIRLFKSYFKDFYITQTVAVRNKINYVLRLIETQKVVPVKFFKFIEGTDGIYEIRVEANGNIFRIFCCLDGGALVILFHGFQKKTQKTPKNQIKRAEAIKKEYDNSKKG